MTILAIVGWSLAVVFFAVMCLMAHALVLATQKLNGKTPIDYVRLAEAMHAHRITIEEFRQSREEKPAGWFGMHES